MRQLGLRGALLLIILGGCQGSILDPGAIDAATVATVDAPAAGAADARVPDARVPDARVADASVPDASVAAPVDARPPPDAPPGTPPDAGIGPLGELLTAHNAVRAVTGPGLPAMSWDPDVAAFAQAWADELERRTGNCDVRTLATPHRPDSGEWAQRYGENISWNAGSIRTPQDIVDGWVSESADYDYDTNSCAPQKVCGHYTQVVWAASIRLGCGLARCDGAGVPFGVSQIWVCNYDPPGNVGSQRPY